MVRRTATLLIGLFLVASCSGASRAQQNSVAPFDQVLLDLFGTTNIDAHFAAIDRDVPAAIVACLNDAGFAMVAPPVGDPYVPPAEGDRAGAESDGFGIIASFRHELREGGDPGDQLQRSVASYLATLTAAEIQRFVLVLDGEPAEPGQVTRDGCEYSAVGQAYRDWNRFFAALPNFTALAEERDSHPDWIAARGEWSDCMAGRGYEYAEPAAIRSDVQRQMRAKVNEAYPGGDIAAAVATGEEVLSAELDSFLDQLVAFERNAAVANIECTEPVADQFAAVEHEVQQAFVDLHRSTIDDLLAAASRS